MSFFKKLIRKIIHRHEFKDDINTAMLMGHYKGMAIYQYKARCYCGQEETKRTDQFNNLK